MPGRSLLALLIPLAPLSGQDSTPAIPALGARVTRIRFFEGGRVLPGVLERHYGTRFDSAATRSVYVEIGLAYPPAEKATALKIECGFTAPSGAPAGTAVVDVQADAGWELSVHAGGTGGETPGGWAAGNYPVACRHAGKIIATGAFEIGRPAPPPVAPPAAGGRTAARPPAKPAAPAIDPNAKTPAVLSGVAVGSLKAKVTALRLFESGGEVPDRKDRVITSTFDALTTRFINIELELEYPRAPRSIAFEIGCRFDGPDSTARTPTVRGSVDPGWVGSYHTAGWGARNRGMWPEGTYKVVCQGDGKTVATSEFKVVRARAAVGALGASLTHLRFFQSQTERLPVETRRYGTRFDARSARWIKTEFGLVYPGAPAPVTFPVECKYTFPDGTVRPITVERRIPAGWTGSVHAQGIGNDRPGSWPAGSYRVSCGNEGREFAAGSFEVAAADLVPVQGSTLRFFARKSGTADAYGTTFDIGAFDSLFVDASLPLRAAADSTVFRCHVSDPAGGASAFTMDGEVRDRALRGSAALGALDGPRSRGTYRVECLVGARAALSDRFTVTGEPELPGADARLTSAAIFEGAETAPDDEAVPDVTFSAARVRSLWLVALLDHPSDRGGTTFPFTCRLLNSRNAALADTGPQAVNVAPGDRAIVLRQRLTLLPRQRWAAGKYSLACASGGVTFVRTTVELTR
jgi:hypothetical protein